MGAIAIVVGGCLVIYQRRIRQTRKRRAPSLASISICTNPMATTLSLVRTERRWGPPAWHVRILKWPPTAMSAAGSRVSWSGLHHHVAGQQGAGALHWRGRRRRRRERHIHWPVDPGQSLERGTVEPVNEPLSCTSPEAEKAKQGPLVSGEPGIAGVTFHVTDRSGVASQCTYSSEGYNDSSAYPPTARSISSSPPSERSRRGQARSHVTTARVRRHLSSTDRRRRLRASSPLETSNESAVNAAGQRSGSGCVRTAARVFRHQCADVGQVSMATFGPIPLAHTRQ